MSAKQGNSQNRINPRRLTFYALLVAAAMVFSYIESLLPLYFIAPGVKIGLSNAVSLLLAAKKDYKGAFAVNLSRITLSNLLFGSPVAFAFAASGGMISLLAVCLLNKTGRFSVMGLSIAGGVLHNIAQLAVGGIIMGVSVVYYSPVLMVAGALSGGAVGAIDLLVLKKIKTNRPF